MTFFSILVSASGEEVGVKGSCHKISHAPLLPPWKREELVLCIECVLKICQQGVGVACLLLAE